MALALGAAYPLGVFALGLWSLRHPKHKARHRATDGLTDADREWLNILCAIKDEGDSPCKP